MEDPTSLDRRFEDIEMLVIPDEDEEINSSSETEGLSDGSSDSDIRNLFSTKTSYIDLQEWLLSDKPLEFKFDETKYKKSLNMKDDSFSNIYVNYVKGMYKSIESLSKTLPNEQKPVEKFGIIVDDTEKEIKSNRNSQINDAFDAILVRLDEFLSELEVIEDIDDENVTRFQNLYSILECLQANHFYANLTNKPELLTQWINRFDHIPDDEVAEEIMVNSPKPYLNSQFWNVFIVQLITRGLFPQAAESISKSKYEELSEKSPELYELITNFKILISEYPNFALKNQFPSWKLSACDIRDSISQYRKSIEIAEHKQILNQIYDLLCIVTGLPKTIANYCDSWYSVFVALSLFKIRDDDSVYREYYDLAIQEKPLAPLVENDIYDVADHCFTDIIQENFLKVIKTIHDFDPSTAAYISKLLELKGYLQIYYTGTEKRSLNNLIEKRTFSEYFLTRHAFESLNIHELVPVGIGLLLNENISPNAIRSKQIVADFLPRFNCITNDDLEWALTICAKLDLTKTSRELYYIHGMKSLDEGHIFESLNMLVNSINKESEDGRYDGMKQIHYITWELIFQDSLINNRPIKDELINNIVGNNVDESFYVHPVIRHCLAPYAVLYGFFNSIEIDHSDKVSKCLSILNHLLRFNYLPKKFYSLLLAQYLPFLTNSKLRFELSDLMIIIDLIDNFETSVTKEQKENAEELYNYAINHFEDDLSAYDWRMVLKETSREVPKTIDQLIKMIRVEIISITGKVFIDV